jgi:CheY-like chemotaxis protein
MNESPHAPRLLVAEDDPFDVMLFKNSLAALSVEWPVAVFPNGVELIEFLKVCVDPPVAERPQVLFLDLGLPQVDGFGVIAWIRSQAHLAHLKIVVVSGACEPNEVRHAVSLGANEFLLKPAAPDTLAEIFTRTLSRPMPA